MLLDIIITVYNVNKYIEHCIESVIRIKNVNVIVIDDGSEEDTSFLKNKYLTFKNFYYYRKKWRVVFC